MAEKAPGKQLSKFFGLIVILFMALTVAGIGIFMTTSSGTSQISSQLGRIETYLQPMVDAGERINSKALYLKIGLLRYVADYDSDPNTVLMYIDGFKSDNEHFRQLFGAEKDVNMQLADIQDKVKKFEDIFQLVITEDSWEQKDALSMQAFTISEDISQIALDIRERAAALIREEVGAAAKSQRMSALNTQVGTYLFACGIFIFAILALMVNIWWKKLQETVLDF